MLRSETLLEEPNILYDVVRHLVPENGRDVHAPRELDGHLGGESLVELLEVGEHLGGAEVDAPA